jgi:hypothetical protein
MPGRRYVAGRRLAARSGLADVAAGRIDALLSSCTSICGMWRRLIAILNEAGARVSPFMEGNGHGRRQLRSSPPRPASPGCVGGRRRGFARPVSDLSRVRWPGGLAIALGTTQILAWSSDVLYPGDDAGGGVREVSVQSKHRCCWPAFSWSLLVAVAGVRRRIGRLHRREWRQADPDRRARW